MSDKTEQPTARRIERAHREGDVPVSQAVMQAAGMLVALALVPSALLATAARAIDMLRASLATSQEGSSPIAPQSVALVAVELSAPLLLAVAAAAAVAGLVQSRGVFALRKVSPDLARLSPLSLFRGLASPQRAFAILRAVVTVGVVGWLVVHRFEEHILDLARTAGRIDAALVVAGTLSLRIARDVLLVLMGLAVVDLLVTHRSWLSRLKMTKTEVKREHRESEGDPELRAARDRAHQELLASATIGAVREATVLIVNPVHLANALRYQDERDEAPKLVAKGQGEIARRMVEAAHAYGIPVVQDVTVARALSELTEGDEIPAALYEAVAVILRDVLEQTSEGGE